MNRHYLVLVALSLACALPASAQQPEFPVPDPPAGYSWVFVPGASTAVLRPDGWYVSVEESDGTIASFVSRENWKEQGKFETGLSFNFVSDISKKTGASAKTYAETVVRRLASTYEVLIAPSGIELAEDLVGIGIRYRAIVEDTPVIVHAQLIADSFRDSVRFLVFESPEEIWDEMWKFGKTMIVVQLRR